MGPELTIFFLNRSSEWFKKYPLPNEDFWNLFTWTNKKRDGKTHTHTHTHKNTTD